MAVSIRFRRCGRRNRPFYRIVVADARSPRDGRFIENIGYYDSIPDPEVVEVKRDRLIYWLLQGAKPTRSLKSILSRRGIWAEVIKEVEMRKSSLRPSREKKIEEIETPIEVSTEPQTDVVPESEQGGQDD